MPSNCIQLSRKENRTSLPRSSDFLFADHPGYEMTSAPAHAIAMAASMGLEDMLDSFADTLAYTFADFPGPFRRADSDVLSRGQATLSNRRRGPSRMECNQVCSALSRACG